MKKLIVIVVMIFLSISINAKAKKNIDIPVKVKDAFVKLHPAIKAVKWESEGKNFEANYKENGKNISLVFDSVGNLIETETEIKISDLPPDVDKYIKKNYKNFKIIAASKIVNSAGSITFEAEISKGKVKKDVLFNSNGQFIKENDN